MERDESLAPVRRPLQRFKSNSSIASIFAGRNGEEELENSANEELSEEAEAKSDQVTHLPEVLYTFK